MMCSNSTWSINPQQYHCIEGNPKFSVISTGFYRKLSQFLLRYSRSHKNPWIRQIAAATWGKAVRIPRSGCEARKALGHEVLQMRVAFSDARIHCFPHVDATRWRVSSATFEAQSAVFCFHFLSYIRVAFVYVLLQHHPPPLRQHI